jgi:formate dehydrogenase gamma subunit
LTEYTVRQINRAKALSRRMYKLPNGERIYLRFPKYQRIEHQTLILSFFTLSFSGLVQRYSHLKIANYIINQLLGGINNVQFIHHVAASIFIAQSIYHFAKIIRMLLIDQELGYMWPTKKDFLDIWGIFLYNIGKKDAKPLFDRFTVEEKLEYWALIWVNIIMIITGLIQGFPVFFTKFFSREILPISKAIHSWEAVLAVLVVLIWHTYHVLVKEKNNSIFTGYLTENQMKENHPLELIRILEAIAFMKEISKIP